jgi:DNA-binding transcriptional ArsR family regulator
MSAEHVGWAFRQPLPATRKFVLVALADRCNKDTLRCDPSISRLADDTGLDRSTVIRALDALEADGYVKRVPRRKQDGGQSTNSYEFPSVTVRPPPSQSATPPSRRARPEPEVEPEVEPNGAAPRKRDEIWDALTTMFGEATTRSEQTNRGKVVRSLKEAGATPAEMFARAKRWPRHYDSATLTENALERHWSTLDPKRKPLRRQ